MEKNLFKTLIESAKQALEIAKKKVEYMKTGQAGRDIIKEYEKGPRGESPALKSYLCPADKWTIGWGHTGKDVKPTSVITVEQAEDLLEKDLEKFEEVVNRNTKGIILTQNQFDALVSLVYNIGPGNFENPSSSKPPVPSTILRKVKAQDWKGAAEQFLVWNKGRVKGKLKVLDGLVRRRKQEKALFETK